MPEFVVAAIAWLGAEIGGTIGAYMMLEVTTAMVSTAMLVGGLAYSSIKARQMREDARSQYNASQVDRLVNISSAKAPRDLVLGRVRKGGTVFFKASTGTNNRDLYLAIALAGHEVDAIEQIYLNDVLVTLDGSGNVTTEPYAVGSTVSGTGATPPVGATAITEIRDGGAEGGTGTGVYNYQTTVTTSNVKITKHLGAAGQVVDADLHAAFPTDWPSTNVCAGIAYIVVKLTYNETSFPSGVPNITAVVRGAKIYDPRTTTTVWSENPALMMRHVYAHSKFGKASVTSSENARFIAAANTCDTSTVYTVGGVAQAARALYKASLVAPFGTPAKSLFDDLSQAMGGSWAFVGGELYLKPGIYTASVMSLTDADLAVVKRSGASEQQSPIGISVHKERASKFNTVKATIWDADQDYKQVALTPLVGAALVTRDGVELVQEVSFPAIFYAPQALHVAGIMMRDARDPLVVDLPFKLRAYPLELFDTVDLTLSRYGWSAKTFMILSRTWNMDGSIQLTLKETSASITQMDADFLAQGWAENTNLPTPWSVAGVGTLTIASGTAELMRQADGTVVSRMRVTWTQVADMAVQQNGQVEVQYRKSDETGPWQSIVVPGNETQVLTSEVQDGIIYIVRARAKTSVAVGDWCAQVQATIVGKTAAASNVAGLAYTATDTSINISWTACTDADYAETELREGASWAAGTVLFKGTANKWSAVGIASGSYTVWAKHKDTSGNYSATASSFSVTFGLVRPITSIGDYASAPATTTLLKNNVYKNTTDGNTYILSADGGTWVLWIAKGATGATGSTGSAGADGAEGSKAVTISAFQWSNSGAGAHSQAFTYTWSSGSVSAYPSGWASSASGSPGTGYTLYQINLIITDLASATTTASNWSAATVNSIGYRQDGSIGATGGTGATGQSARIAYVVNTSGTVPGAVSAGSGDVVPTSGAGTWSFTATSTLSAGQYMYQVDGLYTPGGNIAWGNPYLSNLKVGSLSAISVDLGVVNVSTGGNLHSGKTSAADTTAGFFLGNDSGTPKFSVGDSSKSLTWDGSALTVNGDIIQTGNLVANAVTSNSAADSGVLNTYPTDGTTSATVTSGTIISLTSVATTSKIHVWSAARIYATSNNTAIDHYFFTFVLKDNGTQIFGTEGYSRAILVGGWRVMYINLPLNWLISSPAAGTHNFTFEVGFAPKDASNSAETYVSGQVFTQTHVSAVELKK